MDDSSFMVCPRCGHEGRFHRAEIQNNSPGLAMFLFGGMWAYLLSQSRNDDMFICDRCHYVFKNDPPLAKGFARFVALLAFGVTITFIIVWASSR
jgi:uncharacterized C2H2 Zn-finger protein